LHAPGVDNSLGELDSFTRVIRRHVYMRRPLPREGGRVGETAIPADGGSIMMGSGVHPYNHFCVTFFLRAGIIDSDD
jgi:hypothetical protein